MIEEVYQQISLILARLDGASWLFLCESSFSPNESYPKILLKIFFIGAEDRPQQLDFAEKIADYWKNTTSYPSSNVPRLMVISSCFLNLRAKRYPSECSDQNFKIKSCKKKSALKRGLPSEIS